MIFMTEQEKVIVYSTSTCPYCDMVKTYLKENNIEYVDFDVAADREKAKEMIIKSGQKGVPVLEIKGRIVVGFRPDEIQKALNSTPISRDSAINNVIFDPFDQ